MIVVDASVAVKWIFTEEHADQARALVRANLDLGEHLAAPPLLVSEVTNVIRQRMRREALPLEAARQRVTEFLAVPVRVGVPYGLYHRALDIAAGHDLSATYDAQYVALAEMLNCPLWTADQRLIRSVGDAFPFVRSIADYAPAP